MNALANYALEDYLSEVSAQSDYMTELAATEGLDPYYEAYCDSLEAEAGVGFAEFKSALIKGAEALRAAARLPVIAEDVPWNLDGNESPF